MTAQDPYQPRMGPPAAPQRPPAPGGPWSFHPYPGTAYPAAPGHHPHPVQWPPTAIPAPAMVDGFYLVQPRLKPIPSGQAIGSLVAGIGGILGALPGLLFSAWSPWAGVTFFMMAALLGVGSLLLGGYAKRQVKQAAGGVSGSGIATAGLVLGIIACSLAALTALISLLSI